VSLAFDDRERWHERQRDGVRWTAAAAIVVALHIGGAIVLRGWEIPVAPTEVAPAAVMVDLEPVPVAVPPELPPAPPPPEEPPPTEPEAAPPPPLPPDVVPEVVLPQVVPKPKPVERKRVEKVVPQPVVSTPAPAVEAPPAPAPPRAASSAPPADAMTQFERLLSAHLEREKRYPRMSQQHGEQGVVMLRFTMDRAGKVLAANIERGSGFPALDREVLDLIQRAQPLPALPPEVVQAQLELVVPVQFSLR
jgi:protein TonB